MSAHRRTVKANLVDRLHKRIREVTDEIAEVEMLLAKSSQLARGGKRRMTSIVYPA
jgi:hypothetical protein